jgi:hypothetical protein
MQKNSKAKMGDVVKTTLTRIYKRQLDRLVRGTSAETATKITDPNLFLSGEDLIGPLPDVDKIHFEEWKELQKMVGMDTVKSSVRSVVERLLVNYYREIKGEEPLQVGLSRLFLGPPGTGKSPYDSQALIP